MKKEPRIATSPTRAMQVLVLDDEECLLKMLATYIKRSGYDVLQSTSPVTAREQFKQVNGEVDLLVADVSLGSTSGVEVGLDLKAWNPNLKLLFMSGYPFTGWNIRDAALFCQLAPDSVRVLQKPFSALDLLIKVDELIGQFPQAAISSQAAGSA